MVWENHVFVPGVSVFRQHAVLRPIVRGFGTHHFLLHAFFPNIRAFGAGGISLSFIHNNHAVTPFINGNFNSGAIRQHNFMAEALRPPLITPSLMAATRLLLGELPNRGVCGTGSPTRQTTRRLNGSLLRLSRVIGHHRR